MKALARTSSRKLSKSFVSILQTWTVEQADQVMKGLDGLNKGKYGGLHDGEGERSTIECNDHDLPSSRTSRPTAVPMRKIYLVFGCLQD